MGDSGLPQQRQRRLEDSQGGAYVVTVRCDDRVSSAVVGPKDLVGTIEKVETHDQDHTPEADNDPWTDFHEAFNGLKERWRATYEQTAGEDGPSSEQVREALGTLAGVWDRMAGSVSAALSDPAVREQLKDAGSSLASAIGTTISDLGAELREPASEPDQEE